MKRIIISCILFAAFACACATGGVKRAHYPNNVTPEIKAQFDAADKLYKAKRYAEADTAFANFITQLPYTELTDESRFRRGEIAFSKGNYSLALSFYRQSVAEISSPAIAPKAHFKAALSLYRLHKPDEALEELGRIDRRDASAVLRLRADSLDVTAQKSKNTAPNQMILWQLFILDDYESLQGSSPSGLLPDDIITESDALTEIRRWVGDPSVTVEEVKALPLRAMKGKRSGGYASYKLALALTGEGETRAAAKELKSYIRAYPKHEYYGAANLLLGEVGGATGKAAGLSVGAILPLTGKNALYGESVLHGIECATGIFEPCKGPAGMQVIVRDSESAEGGMAGMVDSLAAEDVIAIIGPLQSAGAPEAAKRAQELGVPLISVSQRDGVAEIGNFIFRNSSSTSSEMRTLADFAVNELRLKRFFILHPANKKGSEYQALFKLAVQAAGGSVVSDQGYSPLQAENIDELRGRGAVELAQNSDEEKSDFTVPAAGFDAVFIPDHLPIAASFAGKIALEHPGKFRLLGISRWGDSRISQSLASEVEGAIFSDSFSKNAADPVVSSFVSNFTSAYDIEPTLLEALGFDAMAMIVNVIEKKGAVHRNSLQAGLAGLSDFTGVTGKIKFNSEGDAERKTFVFTFKDGSIVGAK